jgi:hypothetical protein
MALELRLGVEKRIGVDLPLMSLGDRTATHVAETILAGLQGAHESESEVFNLANAMTSLHGGGDTDVADTVVDLIERPAGVRGGVL